MAGSPGERPYPASSSSTSGPPRAGAASAWRIRRETCIWETPTRTPISDWVRSSTKRSWRTVRSRAGRILLHEPGDRGTVLGELEARVVVARLSARRSPAGSSQVGARAVERDRSVGARRLQHLSTSLQAGARRVSDLRRDVRPSGRQPTDGAIHLDRQLLEVARDPHRPALVTEVTLELAEDRGDREARERGLACRVEPVDGADEPDRATWTRSSSGSSGRWPATRDWRAKGAEEALHERLAESAGRPGGGSARQRSAPRGSTIAGAHVGNGRHDSAPRKPREAARICCGRPCHAAPTWSEPIQVPPRSSMMRAGHCARSGYGRSLGRTAGDDTNGPAALPLTDGRP